MMPDNTVSHALMAYFGGKWMLAPWIIGHMPEHRIYVEPFGGAGSVLLRKPRSAVEVYNDLDEEIVGIFQVIQDATQCRELVRRLRRTPYARREFERAFQSTSDPVIRAQRAIVRAYMAFHHSALFNKNKAHFSNARHRNKSGCKASYWSVYPRVLGQINQRLRGVVIEHRDAMTIIREQDTDDALFFVDPPYVPSTRDKGTRYRCELSEAQHVALLDVLLSVKGRVLISGYPSALYDNKLKSWARIARKHYAGAAGARPRTEILWISPR
ncbi:MAG: DNA adenine methylase [Candidatus Accumulibacter sp.]|jgi:DNA adenine methylase|nr:DNA adenine methylase [Accumulibacter sp.]